MGKRFWPLLATAMLLVGTVLFGGVMMRLEWDFTKLSTTEYETTDYQIREEYKNIDIQTDTADIKFVTAQDGTTAVRCFAEKLSPYEVFVQDDTLTIRVINHKKWYHYIGIHFGTPRLTVTLPAKAYGRLSATLSTGDVSLPEGYSFESVAICTDTGDVTLRGLSADTMSLTTSTGETKLSDVICRNLISSGNTGDLDMKNVRIGEMLTASRSTGDIQLKLCDAEQMQLKTDTGSVTGTLLTPKSFRATTDTGSIKLPDTQSGGLCEITTDTGDIKITIAE